jgi:hypothetical protein
MFAIEQKNSTSPFLPRVSKKVTKGYTALTSEMDRDQTIDLVLIDQQSVGKRSLHLMDNFNVKKRWTTISWRVNNFLTESHIVPC